MQQYIEIIVNHDQEVFYYWNAKTIPLGKSMNINIFIIKLKEKET